MRTILLVDDEHDLLHAMRSILEDEGYDVVACTSGKQALEYTERALPDLILVDVMMPYMSGFELVETMRRNPTMLQVPVVMMSAVEPSSLPAATETTRWVAFLKKPFTLERLIQTVGEHAPNKR